MSAADASGPVELDHSSSVGLVPAASTGYELVRSALERSLAATLPCRGRTEPRPLNKDEYRTLIAALVVACQPGRPTIDAIIELVDAPAVDVVRALNRIEQAGVLAFEDLR